MKSPSKSCDLDPLFSYLSNQRLEHVLRLITAMMHTPPHTHTHPDTHTHTHTHIDGSVLKKSVLDWLKKENVNKEVLKDKRPVSVG